MRRPTGHELNDLWDIMVECWEANAIEFVSEEFERLYLEIKKEDELDGI